MRQLTRDVPGRPGEVTNARLSLRRVVYALCVVAVAFRIFDAVEAREMTQLVRNSAIERLTSIIQVSYAAVVFFFLIEMVAALLAFRPLRMILMPPHSPDQKPRHFIVDAFLGVAGGLCAFLLSVPVLLRGDPGAVLLSGFLEPPWSPFRLLIPVVVVLVLPVPTETFFRGIVLGAFVDHVGKGAALVGSSLLFAAMWPLSHPFLGAILGLASGVLYLRLHRLLPCFFANATAVLCSGWLLWLRGL